VLSQVNRAMPLGFAYTNNTLRLLFAVISDHFSAVVIVL